MKHASILEKCYQRSYKLYAHKIYCNVTCKYLIISCILYIFGIQSNNDSGNMKSCDIELTCDKKQLLNTQKSSYLNPIKNSPINLVWGEALVTLTQDLLQPFTQTCVGVKPHLSVVRTFTATIIIIWLAKMLKKSTGHFFAVFFRIQLYYSNLFFLQRETVIRVYSYL